MVKTKDSPHPLNRTVYGALLLAVFVLMAGAQLSYAQASQDTGPQARLRGHIAAQQGNVWTIDSSTILITPDTAIDESRGTAALGAFVDVSGTAAGETVTAIRMTVLYPAGGNGPIVELSGVVTKIKPSVGADAKITQFWVVGTQPVRVNEPETYLIGAPTVGSLVWVVGVGEGDVVRALAIDDIADDPAAEPVDFEGTIEEIAGSNWRVDGRVVRLTDKSLVLGVPTVGMTAEVRAQEAASGLLTALVLRAVDPNSEAFLNAVINEIVSAPDGTQTWSVTTFAGTGGDMRAEEAQVKITDETYVEERRTALKPGVYAEIDGLRLSTGDVRAELVRLDRPTPVTLSGPIGAPATSGAGAFWTVGGRRVWSATPSVTQTLRSAQRESGLRVTVRGVRLGNGVIWVQSAGASSGNMR